MFLILSQIFWDIIVSQESCIVILTIAAWWYPADPDISLHGKTLSLYNNDDEDYDDASSMHRCIIDDDNHNDDENDDDDDDDDNDTVWLNNGSGLQPALFSENVCFLL